MMEFACGFCTSSLFYAKTSWGPYIFGCFWVSFRFVLVRFRVSRCFLAQVVCALWRLLADSAQVPFSALRQSDSQTARQADRQTVRQTENQTANEADSQDRQTVRHEERKTVNKDTK